jgi:RNA polymerase sigma factor (sigma-70 family)
MSPTQTASHAPRVSTFKPTNLLDGYALDRIEYRVGRLVKLFRLGDADADDLRQELALELVKAADRFDPALATRRTFVSRALDRSYRHIYRRLRARQRHGVMSPMPISLMEDFHPVINDPRSGDLSDQARAELRIDLAPALASLPRHLQQICEVLKTHTPREAADHLGIHRSTIYRAIKEIRSHFTRCGLGDPARRHATDSRLTQI